MPQVLESLLSESDKQDDILERIKLFFISNENRPETIKTLAKKLRTSQKDIHNAISNDAEHIVRRSALFYFDERYVSAEAQAKSLTAPTKRLEKIRQFFAKTENKPCAAIDIAKGLHALFGDVNVIGDVRDALDSSSLVNKETAFCLENRYFTEDARIIVLTNADLQELVKDEKFMLTADIFTKAIANANSISYDDMQSFGRNLAYLYYITQKHEHEAWETDRLQTSVEKRLVITRNKMKARDDDSPREAILRSLLTRKKEGREKDVEILDIMLTNDERKMICDNLVDVGLADEARTEFSSLICTGKAWRYHAYRLNIDKIQKFANKDELIHNELNKQETLRFLHDVMDGSIAYTQQATETSNSLMERLKKLNLIKVENVQAGGSQAEPENVQKYEVIRLSTKLLEYSPHIITKVLETDKSLSLESVLSMLNFDCNEKDLAELYKLGVKTKEDLRKLTTASQNKIAELPRFFEPTFSNYKNTVEANENIRRVVIKDYEGKWRFSDAVAYVIAQSDVNDENLRPKLEVLLVKLGKDAANTRQKLYHNKNADDMKAQAKFGNAEVIEKALEEIRTAENLEKAEKLKSRPWKPKQVTRQPKPEPARVESVNKFSTAKKRTIVEDKTMGETSPVTTYQNIAAAAEYQNVDINTREGIGYITYILQKSDMKASSAKTIAYKIRKSIKADKKAAANGNYKPLIDLLPPESKLKKFRTIPSELEKTVEEEATPAEEVHTEGAAAPKKKSRTPKAAPEEVYTEGTIQTYLTSINKTVDVLVKDNLSVMTPEELNKVETGLAKVDGLLKGYLSNYVAQKKAEMEDAVAKLKEAQDKLKGLEDIAK
jgi:hypothetical protein